jgi:hypothetical protein
MLVCSKYDGINIEVYSPDTPVLFRNAIHDIENNPPPKGVLQIIRAAALWIPEEADINDLDTALDIADQALEDVASECDAAVIGHKYALYPTHERREREYAEYVPNVSYDFPIP